MCQGADLIGECAFRQYADSEAGRDCRPDAGDTLASAHDLILDLSCLEHAEAALTPPTCFVEKRDRQRNAILDFVKDRSNPGCAFEMNDNIASRDDLGRMESDIQFSSRKCGGKFDAGTAPQEDARSRLLLRQARED